MMAWIDDRIWCHPKLTPISDKAFRAYIQSLAFSSGMQTKGALDPSTQRLVGANPRTRAELVDAGLWELNGSNGVVHIHDWDEHNGARDERRVRDRERKREWRKQHGGK